jgi:hypothetical protein
LKSGPAEANEPIDDGRDANGMSDVLGKKASQEISKVVYGFANRIAAADIQQKIGLGLILASVALIALAGAWFGGDPVSGAIRWLLRGLVQAPAAALIALSVWLLLHGDARRIRYLLLLGITCFGLALWDVTAGIQNNRLRLEANEILLTFRDEPLNATGISELIEKNPYVEAYMVMRDAYWELNGKLDSRMQGYSAAYKAYVEKGQFLDVERLQSRYMLWHAFYQVQDLEARLARIEATPLDLSDLVWTIELLDVDRETRDAYARDLEETIATAEASQARLLERERRTLGRIKKSLKVLIDAYGRYRFSKGRIVFDDPEDAARFAGKSSLAE